MVRYPWILFSFIVLGLMGCMRDNKHMSIADNPNKDAIALWNEAKENFKPLPDSIIDTTAKADLIALGKKLYFEKKLSINDQLSCNSCHNLDTFGVDNEPTSPGHEGKRGGRNSPTVYNAALHFAQFWDGREPDVEHQAVGPILNPIEMGMPNAEAVMKKLKAIPEYVDGFKKAGLEWEYKNVGVAIGAYERTLLTPSRFDDYLKGNHGAINEAEQFGLKTFIEVGCISCHNGVAIGGNSYQVIGAVNPYETKDMGRFEVTKDEDDKKMFKVPSLRNIHHTGPYFHDGSVKTLDEAIKLMAHHQLDAKLSGEQLSAIKAFLATLTAKEIKY